MKIYLSRFANILFIIGTLSGAFTASLYDSIDWHTPFIYACFVVPSVIINYLCYGRFIMWNKNTK